MEKLLIFQDDNNITIKNAIFNYLQEISKGKSYVKVLLLQFLGGSVKHYQRPEHEASAMPRFVARIGILILSALRQILSIRFLFLIICLSFCITFLWIESLIGDRNYTDEDLVNEAIDNVENNFGYYEIYRPPGRIQKHLKYILLWTPRDFAPFYYLGRGQRHFIRNNCSMINCYVTTDRNLFGGDVTKFDAIAFNGRNIDKYWSYHLPRRRSDHQKYIFFNIESSDNYPICNDLYDNFFNWTSTYKLDSDIPYGYILIKNRDDEIVGPKKNVDWVEMTDIDEKLPYVQNKSKAAAWFVSNCKSRSNRQEFVKRLQDALKLYGLTVDVYGACGTLHCPKGQLPACGTILQRDYFFYLSLENSFSEDYVTEKVLTAVQHDVVPIVFGGANYSRFLPPHSYLDGRNQTPEHLAGKMAELIRSRVLYQQYFWWKPFYTFHDPKTSENVCSLCAALNNDSMVKTKSVYKEFRKWWNPDYKNQCS